MTAARLRASIAMIAALFLLVLTALVATPTASATGHHGGSSAACSARDGWREVPGATGTELTIEAAEARLIVEVCVVTKKGAHSEIVDPPATSYTVTSEAKVKKVLVREIPDSGGWYYPAPTCEGHLVISYPEGLAGNNHVNIRVRDNVSGDVRTFNFHSATDYAGDVTFDVTEHADWNDWTSSYTYEWVQVAETNYHWEGAVTCDGVEVPEVEQPPVETPEPTPSPEGTPSSEPTPSPEPTEPDVPVEESEGSLEGSVAVGECLNDAPWIAYDVVLSGVEGDLTEHAASLVLTDGTSSETIELGALEADGTLTGRALWPGASVDDEGNPTGWPGWEQAEDGTWVETDGNYAWTRGDLTATIVVNPEIAVELAYPVATPNCATAPPAATPGTDVETPVTDDGVEVEAVEGAAEVEAQAVAAEAESLPQTGSTVLPLVLGALGLVAAGGAAIWFVRRRA